MKRRIGGFAGVLVLLGLLLAAEPAVAQSITLKFHDPFSPSALNLAARWWMDEVEKRTNGKVKFDSIFGGALGALTAQPMAIRAGSFDLGQTGVVYNPGLYPRGTLIVLPFLSDDMLTHAKAAHELLISPALEGEFTALNQKFMFNGLWTAISMMSFSQIKTIDDMRKIRIRAHGGSADALKVLGITTYPIPWSELPAAAERRVVDAAIIGAPVDAYEAGFGQIFSYWNKFSWFYFPLQLVMNLDTWKKLPADVQKAIEDLNATMPTKVHELRQPAEREAEMKLVEGGLVKVVEFDELEKLKAQTAKAVWDKWVADRKAQGINGQALLDEFLRLVRKHQ